MTPSAQRVTTSDGITLAPREKVNGAIDRGTQLYRIHGDHLSGQVDTTYDGPGLHDLNVHQRRPLLVALFRDLGVFASARLQAPSPHARLIHKAEPAPAG